MSVLVDRADSGVALTIVRSLGRRGVDVTAAASKKHALTFYSKYCKRKLQYPSPKREKELFIKKILEFVKNNNYEVLFTLGGIEMELISQYRHEFSSYVKIPLVNHETLMKARDKGQVLKIAMENDIPCPETHFPEKVSDVEEIKNKLNYPVVIKPRFGRGAKGVTYVTSPKELVTRFRQIVATHGSSIIQEYIPHGGAYGFEALFNEDSKLRAFFVHKRIREYPVTGGPSTLRESVYYPEAVKYGTKLLETLNWYGVAMVEFRKDPRDGKLKLMEINPRFWGSLALSVAAGVDFPYLLYKMAVDGDIKPVFDYKTGVKCRWLLFGDIKHLLSVMKGVKSDFGFKSPSRFKTLIDFLKFYEKDLHYDILSLDDPKPAIFKILRSILRV